MKLHYIYTHVQGDWDEGRTHHAGEYSRTTGSRWLAPHSPGWKLVCIKPGKCWFGAKLDGTASYLVWSTP